MTKRTWRHIGELCLTLVLTFCLFLTSTLVVTRLTLMSPNFMKLQIQRADYAATTTKAAHNAVVNLGLGSGVPKSVFTGVPSQKAVQTDLDYFVDRAYAGAGIKLPAKTVRAQLTNKLADYQQQQDLNLTTTQQKAVQTLIDQSMVRYTDSIQIPYLNTIGKSVRQVDRYLILILSGMVVLTGLLIFILWRLLRYRHRLWRYLAYSLLANGVMLLVGPYWLLYSRVITRLAIQTKALYQFVVTYLQAMIWIFIIMGLLSFALGLGATLISELKRRKKIGVS